MVYINVLIKRLLDTSHLRYSSNMFCDRHLLFLFTKTVAGKSQLFIPCRSNRVLLKIRKWRR